MTFFYLGSTISSWSCILISSSIFYHGVKVVDPTFSRYSSDNMRQSFSKKKHEAVLYSSSSDHGVAFMYSRHDNAPNCYWNLWYHSNYPNEWITL